MKKKLLSLLLALAMVISLFPTMAFAVDGDSTEDMPTPKKLDVELIDIDEEAEEAENIEVVGLFEDNELFEQPKLSAASPKKAMLLATPPAEGDVCQVGEGETATGYTSLDEAIAANKNTDNVITITLGTALAFTAASTLAAGDYFHVNDYNLVDFANSTFPNDAKTFGITGTSPDQTISINSYIAKTSLNTYATLDEAIKANKNTNYAISIPNVIPGNTPTVTAAAELQAGDYFYITRTGYSLTTFSDDAFPDGYGKTVYSIKNNTTHYEIDVEEFVAQNVTTGVGYTSLSTAISKATAGQTVKLLKNQSLANIPISNKNQITLDLNKKTINFTNVGFYLSDNVNLTIKNGTVKTSYVGVYSNATPNLTLENIDMTLTAGDYYAIWLQNGGTLNLVNTHIKVMCGEENTPYAIQVEEKSPYNITFDKNSTIDSSYMGICLYGSSSVGTSGGTLNVYGKINALGFAISTSGNQQKGDDVINIFPGAEVKSQYAHGIYAPAKGVINMTGGKLSGDGSGIAIKSGKLNVSGGEIICTGEDCAPTEGWSNGANPSGAAIQIESNSSYGDVEVNISGDAKITSSDGYSIYEYINGTDPMRVKSLSITGGQFTGLISLSEQFAGTAAGKGFISAGLYDKEIKGDKVKFIADGYDCIPNADPTTKDDYPWIVTHVEVKVDQASIEEKVSDGSVTTTEGTLGEGDKNDAKKAITDMAKNTAVQSFADTNIDNATKELSTTADGFNISMVLDAVRKEANKQTADSAAASANGQITVSEQTFTDVDVDKKINVELETAKVEIKTEGTEMTTKTTTVNGATYDVKPTATITVTNSDGTITKITAEIPNEAITKPITFRLPIDKKITAATTAVWHSDDLSNPKADYLGIFPIQEENGEKFVELSSQTFSYFTYENMTDVEETSVVAIRTTDGKYVGFDTLGAAITAYLAGTDDNADTVDNSEALILLKDVTENADFDSKTIELDLNGQKLKGASTNAANVTVMNSGEKQNTLSATGTYANDVSEFVPDGYDTQTTTVENDTVVNTSDVDYTVIVNAVATDRNTENGKQTGRKDGDTEVDLIDVYAGDIVTVNVTVKGARFVAADLTLKYDPALFEDVTALEEQVYTWTKETAKSQYRFTATGGDQYFEDGTVIGTFKFKAKAIGEDLVAQGTNVGLFKVYDAENVRPIYVSDSWSSGYFEDPSNALDENHAINDQVNIIMMPTMTGSVDARTGLVYNGTAMALTTNPSAKVDGVELTSLDGVKIQYALSETSVTGDENIKALTYTDDVPEGTDAGTYYVYYKISAPGYTTVYGNRSVTIAKKQVTLTWTFDSETNKNAFEREYKDAGYTAPTATFNLQGTSTGTADATVTMKTLDGVAVAAGTDLKAVGTYVFEASYKDANGKENYTFAPNPTATVTIKGREMKGWSFEGAPAQYIDGKEHPVAVLTLDTAAEGFGPAANDTSLEITFSYSDDNGATWKTVAGGPFTTVEAAQAAIPKASAEGTYKMKMTVKADTYETTEFPVTTFSIKKPVYVVEVGEYVSGWTEIRVYTNETVTFRYGDDESNMLYDVTSFGYRYNNLQSYQHVYALVVEGEANLGKIYASNNEALKLNLPEKMPDGITGNKIYDVNASASGENAVVHVSLEDAVAAQSVYNVNLDYMNNKMAIVILCDVNRDKKVDVAGDVTAILNEYVTNWNA